MVFMGRYSIKEPKPVIPMSSTGTTYEIMNMPDIDGTCYVHDSEKFALNDKNNRWSGEVLEHVYRVRLGFNKDVCPICFGSTMRKYVNTVYISDTGSRQCLSPAGWICAPCKCIVIDEDIVVKTAMLKGHKYFFPLGIRKELFIDLPASKDDLTLFETFEGKIPVFVIDEDTQNITDVLYKDDLDKNDNTKIKIATTQNQKNKAKNKAKRIAEKLARKKNRR